MRTVWASLGFAGWLLLAFPLAVGIGRTFRATMAEPSHDRTLTAALPDEERSFAGSQPRASVLIVDDDPGFRTLLRTTIEQSDLVVIEAASAEEATKMTETSPVSYERPSIFCFKQAAPRTETASSASASRPQKNHEARVDLVV